MSIFADAAYESINHYGEELCGDTVEMTRDDKGFYLVLADGLGSGVKANILSTLTAKIIVTMMSEGASLTESVETIASTLPKCSERGLAYSTFTIVRVENDGGITTAEFDNPMLIYFRDGKRMDIPRGEVEVDGKKIYVSKFRAQVDDMLITFSDGVVHAGVGSLLDLGWQYDNIVKFIEEAMEKDISPRVMAKKVVSTVNTLYMNKPGDDSTVCALRLRESKVATVMVGPPVNPDLDQTVVNKLMYAKGLKVVCGGTTSQIVSRVTGREVKVLLDYENPALPPTAQIPGVDLVTEGVLTLRKALENIRQMNEVDGGNEVVNYRKKDGATRITRLLLEDCTEVHFLVGQALNEAHQNPGMPVSLGLKLNLINELAAELQTTGKRVTVEYF